VEKYLLYRLVTSQYVLYCFCVLVRKPLKLWERNMVDGDEPPVSMCLQCGTLKQGVHSVFDACMSCGVRIGMSDKARIPTALACSSNQMDRAELIALSKRHMATPDAITARRHYERFPRLMSMLGHSMLSSVVMLIAVGVGIVFALTKSVAFAQTALPSGFVDAVMSVDVRDWKVVALIHVVSLGFIGLSYEHYAAGRGWPVWRLVRTLSPQTSLVFVPLCVWQAWSSYGGQPAAAIAIGGFVLAWLYTMILRRYVQALWLGSMLVLVLSVVFGVARRLG
jgi:hypothetical protein